MRSLSFLEPLRAPLRALRVTVEVEKVVRVKAPLAAGHRGVRTALRGEAPLRERNVEVGRRSRVSSRGETPGECSVGVAGSAYCDRAGS